jgi:hypothetical protein
MSKASKGKKAMSKEDSTESVEYPSGELKVRKKGSKLNNGSGKKQAAEEPQSAASKKAAAKKRARKSGGQSRNIWLVGFLSFLTAAIGSALFVYNWSLHDDFDLTNFWSDNEQKVMAIVEQVASLFAQQQFPANATNPAIEAPPPPAASATTA